MHYLVGDLQGCCDALERLLATLDFSPSRDRLTLLGDLVNRGPASLRTLQRLRGLGDSAQCLLGNHDLHLLAVHFGGRQAHRDDTLTDILDSPDREALIEWLRAQKMALVAEGWLCVHAGVAPAWDAATTLALADEVQVQLRDTSLPAFPHQMYANEPRRWDPALTGAQRLRFIINVLTRIRFVEPDGALDLKTKEGAGAAPPGLLPWFEAPGRASAGTPIAFGHWSTLGLVNRPDLLALDTGCVWGGALTAVRVDGGRRDVVQVACAQARQPGA